MKAAYKSFLVSLGEEKYKVESLEDERLGAFMFKDHPRFYQLCEMYGSPLEIVKVDQKANL